jgi:hypothetical protein
MNENAAVTAGIDLSLALLEEDHTRVLRLTPGEYRGRFRSSGIGK